MSVPFEFFHIATYAHTNIHLKKFVVNTCYFLEKDLTTIFKL